MKCMDLNHPIFTPEYSFSSDPSVCFSQTTLFYGKFVLLVYVPRDDYFATFGQLADAVTTAQKVCVCARCVSVATSGRHGTIPALESLPIHLLAI